MIDIENPLFTLICQGVEQEFPGIQCVSEIPDTPAAFPTLCFRQGDNQVYRKTLDGSLREHHALCLFEADVFSNQEAGGKEQCRDILHLVDDLMTRSGFVRVAFGLSRSGESRLSRGTARYQGVVSEDYRVYRR